MRTKNPQLMNDIKEYIADYYKENLESPGLIMIAEHVGSSKSNVQRYLVEMKEKGMLEYDRGVRNPEVLSNCSNDFSAHPITGNINCGDPRQQEENIEEYVVLPDAIFGRGPKYILRAEGDSMTDAGIEEGDLVVIGVTPEAIKGDIVVALDGEGQNTLKRYEGYDETTGEHILGYMNEKAYPGEKIRVKKLCVQGVVKNVIKSY